MNHILCLETATTNCSVSIAANGETIALVERADNGYSHSENLHTFIKEALESASLSFSAIDAVAISKGPGSYTGLRIGVSAAKGLCFALNKPLISLPTLEVLAHQVKNFNGKIVPMLDARRMEVYTAVYNFNYERIKPTWAEILTNHSFINEMEQEQVFFIGNSNEKAKTLLNHPNAIFDTEVKLPSAREMGILAHNKFLNKDFEDVAYFEPYYLKDFVGTKPKKGAL